MPQAFHCGGDRPIQQRFGFLLHVRVDIARVLLQAISSIEASVDVRQQYVRVLPHHRTHRE